MIYRAAIYHPRNQNPDRDATWRMFESRAAESQYRSQIRDKSRVNSVICNEYKSNSAPCVTLTLAPHLMGARLNHDIRGAKYKHVTKVKATGHVPDVVRYFAARSELHCHCILRFRCNTVEKLLPITRLQIYKCEP